MTVNSRCLALEFADTVDEFDVDDCSIHYTVEPKKYRFDMCFQAYPL